MMRTDAQFLEAVQELLNRCPRCGGDGYAKDPSLVCLGVDDYFAYEPCPVCDEIREAIRVAYANVDE